MPRARAALKLDDLTSRRGAAPPPAAPKDDRRGQTLRLKQAAWAQLKVLAVEQARDALLLAFLARHVATVLSGYLAILRSSACRSGQTAGSPPRSASRARAFSARSPAA